MINTQTPGVCYPSQFPKSTTPEGTSITIQASGCEWGQNTGKSKKRFPVVPEHSVRVLSVPLQPRMHMSVFVLGRRPLSCMPYGKGGSGFSVYRRYDTMCFGSDKVLFSERARVGDTGRMQPVRKVLTEWEATEQSLGCNGLLILCVDRINQSTTRVKKMVGQARIHTKIS